MSKSRVLLLAAVTGLAAALALGAVILPQSAEANRTPIRKVQTAGRARQLAMVAELHRNLGGIHAERNEAWKWQDVMFARHFPYGGYAEHTRNLRYSRSVLTLWTKRASQARWSAQHPPRYRAWLCIHRYEGSWTDPNAPYYGGLQMDMGFMQAYGARLLRAKGTADHWTPLEQIWVAERAYESGRGFYPWPTTARYCGLL